MAAFTKPTRIKTMVAAANNHLINVVMAVVRASASGVDGKTESIITVPRFLSISLQCMDLQIKHPPILVVAA